MCIRLLHRHVSGSSRISGRSLADGNGNIHGITVSAKSKFYNMREWHTFNGDESKDILTVRVSRNSFTPRIR